MFALSATVANAQNEEEELEEIVVTGTQIKGARISDSLAVSVLQAEDIELLGVESGDELLDLVPENGMNMFSEADTAGGVNAARGDVGAFNLRNLGTGNTLVLLNGRRLVNMATYQTEEVGGSFVPVNSANSNHIPVFGVERLEILRDGASAIYGADAVAGVVNTVLKNDFEGFTIRLRYDDYDNIPRDDQAISLEWGDSFNGGATHVGVFARHLERGRVNSSDDPRWADSDFRWRVDPNLPEDVIDEFQGDSANSLWGQWDVLESLPSDHSLRVNNVVDSSGEFETYPIGDARCDGGFDTGLGTCTHADGQGTIRYNFNDNRDIASEMNRSTIYGYVNHEFDSGLELFGEVYYYTSETERFNSASTDLGAVTLRLGPQNYYSPLGPITSPNRLPPEVVGPDLPDEGYELNMDLYRFAEYPRITYNDGEATRFLAGLRGIIGDWDWESAVTWSEATRDETTKNRISNTLITIGMFDPNPTAYNPFSGGVNSNIEQALVDVYRNGKSTLGMADFKISNPAIFDLPAGPVGILAGYEYRRETYLDDRDPRLDGTIRFMRDPDLDGNFEEGDFEGDTYPETSDVVGSSPTPDGAGSRKTHSLFTELAVPVLPTLDVQLAARFEDFDDVGNTTVGKVAFGWRPIDQLLFRGSWSEAFRAPNLITINEQFIARSNTRNDWVCFYGVDQGSLDPDTFSDCDYGVQRQATGSKSLKPEESTNTSIGLVIEPTEGLTFTIDFWDIEKKNTIGLFGEENHILYDLVLRLEQGTGNCAAVVGNPLVVRDDPVTDPADVQGFLDAGLCPVGQVLNVQDSYANLDTRSLRGYDIGAYYSFDTDWGAFNLRYNGAFYDEFSQTGSGELTTAVQEAQAADPTIVYPIQGLGNLLGINGNTKNRQSYAVGWNRGDYAASITGFRVSGFHQILDNGYLFAIPSMTTYNSRFDYSFDMGAVDMRVRLGINNLFDERAPLSENSYGYYSDVHRDYGRYYYVDLRIRL